MTPPLDGNEVTHQSESVEPERDGNHVQTTDRSRQETDQAEKDRGTVATLDKVIRCII
jgi:hypothetical protein